MVNPQTPTDSAHYQRAFELAPIGLALSRERIMIDVNLRLCEVFGASREQLVGQSFMLLYPSADEFERTGARIAPRLEQYGFYADDRLMRRVGGRLQGQTFWCHVTGRALHRSAPHAEGIWTFEDLSEQRPAAVAAGLTPREREVAVQLTQGLTSKAIGRVLGISHRTVELHRARLLRKYSARTTAELVQRLLGGGQL